MNRLLYAALAATVPSGVWFGIAALVLAALGGLVLNLHFHWNRRELPIWMILAHALVALIGLALIAVSAWR